MVKLSMRHYFRIKEVIGMCMEDFELDRLNTFVRKEVCFYDS